MMEGWKTVRIFISSTFKDMHAERDYLISVIFPELGERMALRRLHLRAIDLRWGVLKEEDSLDVCLSVIEDCRPYFIGLLGNRYGSIPPPPPRIERAAFEGLVGVGIDRSTLTRLQTVYRFDDYSQHYLLDEQLTETEQKDTLKRLENAGLWGAGQSITAQEIFRGVLDDQQQQMVSYFYFRNEEATEHIPEPYWETYNEKDATAREKIRGLKQRIRERDLRPRVYDCGWDDKEKKITDLEEFGRVVLEDLWAAIASRYSEGHETESEAVNAEREAMEYLIETRTQHFVGREELLRQLVDFVKDRLTGGDGNTGLACVVGEAGSGKSALLGTFYRELSAGTDAITVAHFVGASAASTNAYQMLTRIWAEVNDAAGLREDIPAEFYEIVRALPGLLARAAEVRPVCIVIDAINQLETAYNAHDVRWLPESLPHQVCIILSTSEDETLDALRRRATPPRELLVAPLRNEDVRGVIQRYLDQHFRKLAPDQVEALLAKSSTRNPLYLLVALEELRVAGRYDTLIDQIAAFPEDVPGLLESLLDRLENEHGRELVQDFLSLLAIGRGGQDREDLRALLKPEGELRLPDLNWARLLRSLQFYLLRRSESVDFHHQQLREAAERRYLTPESRRDYHEKVGRYLAERGINYPRSLSELAYHLKQAGLDDELYALIDRPEFRQAKLSATHSIYSLCSDIGFALDAAFERNDLSEMGHFGFMHADYSEGRLGRQNVLDLHRRDRKAALQEVRFLRERPRLRILILLALREAEAGQIGPASELIQDAAAIDGVKLPESDSPFLACAVAALLKRGCNHAPALLTTTFREVGAAAEAARISAGMDRESQAALLGAAIRWLKNSTKVTAKDEKLIDAFGAVARAVSAVEDANCRETLFKDLEDVVDEIKTGLEDAIETQDTLLFGLMAALSISGGGTGGGTKQAAQAHLGAAIVRSGNEERGYALVERAIDACDKADVDSFVFGSIARALRAIPSSQSTRLFRRLVAKSAGSSPSHRLLSILNVLAEDQDDSCLGDVLDVVAPAVRALPIRQSTPLLTPLALAYVRAGQKARARLQASHLDASVPLLSLLAHNPFVSAEHKLRSVRGQVELEALTGRKGREWTKTWLNRVLRWLTRLDSEQVRVSQLKELLNLSGEVGESSAIVAGLKVADSIRSEALRAEALETILDASKYLDSLQRATLRDRALERAARFGDESARSRVWNRWLETANADEIDQARTLGRSIEQLRDDPTRAEASGRFAGAMARLGSMDEAAQGWFQAAMADQETSTRSPRFAAAVAARGRFGDQDDWEEVIRDVHCPDPEVAAEMVAVAAGACEDAQRMALLEKEVRKLRSDQVIKKHISQMYLALARGWARLGDEGRGAHLASLAHKAGAEVPVVIELTPLLIGHPAGRELLLRMIPFAHSSGPTENSRFNKLASVLAKVREEDWAREGFRQLYLAALARETGSKWRDLEAVAAVIEGIATRGQARLAYDLARKISMPTEETVEDELLQAGARGSSLAQLGATFAAIHRVEPGLGALTEAQARMEQALSAAAEVTGDLSQGEVCSSQARVWTEARRSHLPVAHRAEREAAATARKMAAEKHVSKWGGLSTLARRSAEMGEGQTALALAGEIAEDKDREELLVDLSGKLSSHSFEDTLECWKEISTAEQRRRAAWNIAKGFFGESEDPDADANRQAPGRASAWPPFSTFRSGLIGGFLPGLILTLGLPLTSYWLALKAMPLAREGLSGQYRPHWLTGLIAVALVSLIMLSRSFRQDVKNIFACLGLSVLAIAFAPFILGILLFLKYEKVRPSLRVKSFLLRKRLSRAERVRPASSPRGGLSHLSGYRELLRKVVSESGPFDILFGAMLYNSASGSDAASVLARLPEVRLPSEVPEKLKKDRREYAEIDRTFRKTYKLRKKIVSISSRVGIWITKGFLAPLALSTILWRISQMRRARRAAVRGDEHLNAHRYEQAARLLGRAARLSPDTPQYWHDFAVALANSGKTDQAVEAHREATQRGLGSADEPQLWYGMGFTLWRAGRYEEALEAFDQVLKIAPRASNEYTEASRGREYCLSNLGRQY